MSWLLYRLLILKAINKHFHSTVCLIFDPLKWNAIFFYILLKICYIIFGHESLYLCHRCLTYTMLKDQACEWRNLMLLKWELIKQSNKWNKICSKSFCVFIPMRQLLTGMKFVCSTPVKDYPETNKLSFVPCEKPRKF